MNRITLWAQRRAHLMPAPVRRLGGRTLAALAGAPGAVEGPSEDWSTPLVARDGVSNVESLPVAATGVDDGAAAPCDKGCGSGTPLRAVVAIDVLDVGGMDE